MKTNFIIFLLCLVGLIYYAYHTYTHTDHRKDKGKTIFQIEINGKTAKVTGVKVVQIPQATYDSMADNSEWKDHLLGNKKRVLFVTWEGCPHNRAFKQSLQKVFNFPNISNFYTQDFVLTGQSVGVSCKGNFQQYCPKTWIMDHCTNRICIINPKTHEAIIDSSHDTEQALPLLAAYAQWDATPLLSD